VVVVLTIISAIVNQLWHNRMKNELVQWTKKMFVVNYVEEDEQVKNVIFILKSACNHD
jgi:hypothetical protein